MKHNFSPSYHVFAFTGTTLDCTLLLQYNFAVTFALNKHIKFLRFLIKKVSSNAMLIGRNQTHSQKVRKRV